MTKSKYIKEFGHKILNGCEVLTNFGFKFNYYKRYRGMWFVNNWSHGNYDEMDFELPGYMWN